MSLLPRAAHRLLSPLSLAPVLRPAVEADVGALAELIAPHVASGAVLPRALEPEAFLVAELEGELVGCVALTPWTGEVVELGTLVSARPGLGRLLVEAACASATAAGFSSVVALTAVDGFFLRVGFLRRPVAPWAVARGLAESDEAVAIKARKCAACPRLGTCDQVLLARPLRLREAA